MLPKVSGEQFCEWVKEQVRNEVSIIMLSAKVQTADKIHGLRLGADSGLEPATTTFLIYLTKYTFLNNLENKVFVVKFLENFVLPNIPLHLNL